LRDKIYKLEDTLRGKDTALNAMTETLVKKGEEN
jgi:hypothetical protein